LHEHLETVNQPMYFYQFAAQAAEAGLQFLSEAELSSMSLQGLAADVRNIVKQLSKNIIECEQYVDFIRNRTFRRTLLCHRDTPIDWRGMNKRVRLMHISSPGVPEGQIDVTGKAEGKFKLAAGTLTTQVPVIKAALLVLSERWPQTMPFEELLDESLRRMGQDPANPATQREKVAEFLAENLVQCLGQRAIHFFAVPLPVAARVGERPRGFRVARRQAKTEARVTSLLHELVQLNDFDRQLLQMCDGERTRGEIIEQMADDVRSGKLKASQPINEPGQLKNALEKALNDGLARLNRVALLEA
jgi:methyltransferase-like protein